MTTLAAPSRASAAGAAEASTAVGEGSVALRGRIIALYAPVSVAWPVLAALLAQAEPAPPASPVRPPDPEPAPVHSEAGYPATSPAWAVGFAAGIGLRLPPPADESPPATGMSVTVLLGRRYAIIAQRLEFGGSVSLGYERYARTVTTSKILGPGQEVSYETVRSLSQFDFVALQTLTVPVGRVRLWLAAGAGLGLGHFTSEERELAPGEARATRLIFQGGGGIDVDLRAHATAGIRVETSKMLRPPALTTEAGQTVRVFGDRVSARAALGYRF